MPSGNKDENREESDRGRSGPPIDAREHALDHPLRRGALRILNGAPEAVAATDLARQLETSKDLVIYHLKVLRGVKLATASKGPLRQGKPENYFTSSCQDEAKIDLILAEHEIEDAELERTRRKATAA